LYALNVAGDAPEVNAARRQWQEALQATFGSNVGRLERGLDALAASFQPAEGRDPLALLFAVQTYYVLIVKLLAWEVVAQARRSLLPSQAILGAAGNDALRRLMEVLESDSAGLGWAGETVSSDPWAWYLRAWSEPIDAWLRRVARVWSGYDFDSAVGEAIGTEDLLKSLYQEIFPKRFRHVLGEYYTPEWLVDQMLDEVGYSGDPAGRLLDPACGSGGFLVRAIRRVRAHWRESVGRAGAGGEALCRAILSSVAGIDLNPLAVVTARANYLIAIRDLLPPAGPVETPVYWGDSILGRHEGLHDFAGRFDYVVGNPPWIAWDDLPADDRQATKPLWQHYGLFTLSGSDARHGGGKKDLSMLMIYAAADRYLKPSGRLAMVITQTVFQTRGAGDGFRRFRLGEAGAWLEVLRVNDLVELRPFSGTANWSATLTLEKGRRTTYPVPYMKYSADGRRREFDAVPIDPSRPNSPWFLRPHDWIGSAADLVGPSDYTAHLGANTGGANGVYWVTLCDEAGSVGVRELVRVRNIAERGKHRAAVVEHLVESELVYPLLCWGDVDRFSARPAAWLLLAQDVETRRGIDEARMQRQYPNAYAYLAHFRELLEGRAAYRRYQSRAAFYSMYDVGPYTLAPFKVVWRRMDRRIHAAVVEAVEDPRLGRRPMVPQETCVLVAIESADEAHYLCAMMNSSLVGFLVTSHSVRGGKSFGSPGMFDFLRIRQYDPGHAIHRELAEASRNAHCLKASGSDVASIQDHIDRLAVQLLGVEPPRP
jgi:predicted RNA methylase